LVALVLVFAIGAISDWNETWAIGAVVILIIAGAVGALV
jgi:hypothetical protein